MEARVAALICLAPTAGLLAVLSPVTAAIFSVVALGLIGRAALQLARGAQFLRMLARRDLEILEGELTRLVLYHPVHVGSVDPLSRTLLVSQTMKSRGGCVRLAESRPLTATHVSLRARDPGAADHLVGAHVHVLGRRVPSSPGGPFRGEPGDGPSMEVLLVSDVGPARLRGPVLARTIVWAGDVIGLGAMIAGAWALALWA